MGRKVNQGAETLDLKGLKCPLPVLRTRRHLREVGAGSIIRVETTDPLAVIDIPHFCNQDGHMLIDSQGSENGHSFTIRKGSDTAQD